MKMQKKILLTFIILVTALLGFQTVAAQSLTPSSPVQELPRYEDIPWCHDLSKDSGVEYCKGGEEGFQGSWFPGLDK